MVSYAILEQEWDIEEGKKREWYAPISFERYTTYITDARTFDIDIQWDRKGYTIRVVTIIFSKSGRPMVLSGVLENASSISTI